MRSIRSIALLACAGILSANAFAPSIVTPNKFSDSSSSLMMAKGRRSLRKTVQGSVNTKGVKPMADQDMTTKRTNWQPVKGLSSMKDLPSEENKVQLVDTMAESLINGATNPTGAVSVVNYEGNTYCFASSCSCCQIPLTKAKVLPPNDETDNAAPRISCDFCKATYNVRTGERVENAEKAGMFGGIVTGLFSKSEKVPLPIYDLGEKSGQVLINLP